MPSTYTSNLGVEKPGTGEQDGVWGDTVNENMDIIDRAINGVLSLTLTGTSSTLTTSDGVLSNGQYKLLALTGTPPSTHTITIAPNDAAKIYYVSNACGQSVVFAQGSGPTTTVAAGDTAIIYAFGTGAASGVANLTDHFAMSSVNITGGAITGATINNAVIGGTTPVAGTFTTLSGTTSLTSPLLSAGLGTAAAPSVTFTGDTNTGVWSPTADTFAVSTDGVERLRINSAGNVGIGTNNPLSPLQVNAPATAVSVRLSVANTTYANFFATPSSVSLLNITAFPLVFGTNNTERMRVHASGGVSIGNTTDPGATNLSVTGVVSNSLGAAATPSITFTGDTNTGIYSPGADTFAVSTGGVERFRIDSAGEVGIGTNNPLRPLHIVTSGATNAAAYLQNDTGDATIFLRSQDTGAVSIQFGDTTAFNSGLIQYSNSTDSFVSRSAGAMTFQTGGATERARIHASGGVSIGNATDPGATNLSVAGAISTGDAATTRTNLGLTIGTNVQAYDAGLQSISGLTTAANQMIYTTAADTYATTALTAAGRALLDDADAAAQRTTLGLTIGTNVQAYDAGLQSIAGLTTAADRMIYTTAADTYAVTTLTAAGRALLDDADAAAQRTTLGLTIGTNVQAYDAGLQSISGLTTAANQMIYTTAADTYATTGLTAAGRALLDDADAAAQRTTLGLGSMATQAASSVAITGGSINGSTIGATTAAAGTFTTGTFGLGAVATPSITITGDPNTGLWSPGADTLAVSTGGVERLRLSVGSLLLPALTTEARQIEIGSGRAGDGNSFIDLIGDATYTDYGARFIREPGANAKTQLVHRGTGELRVSAQDAGSISLATSNAERVRIEANGNVGIGGTATGTAILDLVSTTKGFRAPSMTTTQRDAIVSPAAGLLIYNTTLNFYQVYNGTAWTSVGGGATGGGTDQVFFENGQTVTTNYTITNGKNAMSAGPITINAGVTVTVGDGEVWTIV